MAAGELRRISLAGSVALPPTERAIATALFSRHHDGRVREACLRSTVGRTEPWIPPFVVQLAGEYVVEIAEVIRSSLDALNRAAYKRFVKSNPDFMNLTRQRAISYWDCYCRRQLATRVGHPTFAVLDFLAAL